MNDGRFTPITLPELPHLQCGVSLLTNFKTGRSWDDWEIGTEGISVTWMSLTADRQYSATFLPEIASQMGWDHKETMMELVRKAGQQYTPRLLEGMQVTTYETSKVVVEYQDYLQSMYTTI